MHSIEFQFDMHIIGHLPTHNIDFCVYRIIIFLQDIQNLFYNDLLKLFEVHYVLLNYINPIKTDTYYCFNYAWSSFEIMCFEWWTNYVRTIRRNYLIVLLLLNMELFTHNIFLLHCKRSHTKINTFKNTFCPQINNTF